MDQNEIDQISKACHFTIRERKITAYELLELILFSPSNNYLLSLEDMSVAFLKKYKVEVSKQAIDKKFTAKSVVFIKSILEKALQRTLLNNDYAVPLLFNQVRIKDSTCFKVPDALKEFYPGAGGRGNASKATIRIQFEFDIKTGRIIELELMPFLKQDQKNAKETLHKIEEGDLIIRDLGYFSIEALNSINQKAYYISRLDTSTNMYEERGNKYHEVNVEKIEKKLRENNLFYHEHEVFIGEERKIKARMIVFLVPEEVKNNRLREYYVKNRKVAIRKRKSILRAGVNIFITNVPNEKIEAKNIRNIYAIRWQIELIFKGWKSIGQLDKVKKMKVQRFEFMLYARLLWLIINWKIIFNLDMVVYNQTGRLLSFYKILKYIDNYKEELRIAKNKTQQHIEYFLIELLKISKRKYERTMHKKKVNLLDVINLLITQDK